jgi:hypothetical protein
LLLLLPSIRTSPLFNGVIIIMHAAHPEAEKLGHATSLF